MKTRNIDFEILTSPLRDTEKVEMLLIKRPQEKAHTFYEYFLKRFPPSAASPRFHSKEQVAPVLRSTNQYHKRTLHSANANPIESLKYE